MTTYARIVDGRVLEVIEPFLLDDGHEVPIEERFHPSFVAQLVEYDPTNPPPAPPSPEVKLAAVQVTMRQARLALLAAGKLAGVDAAIAQLPSPQKEAAQIEWDYSSTVDRQSTIVGVLGGLLGFDEAALDALFEKANSL